MLTLKLLFRPRVRFSCGLSIQSSVSFSNSFDTTRIPLPFDDTLLSPITKYNELCVVDMRTLAQSKPNIIKPPTTQVLTRDELFNYDRVNNRWVNDRYRNKEYANFQEISINELKEISESTYFLRAEYKPLPNAHGRELELYAKSKNPDYHPDIQRPRNVPFSSTASFVKVDGDISATTALVATAHACSPWCDSRGRALYNGSDPKIAGELDEMAILRCRDNVQSMKCCVTTKWTDIDHDIAILECLFEEASSAALLLNTEDVDLENVREVTLAGYRNANTVNDSRDKRINKEEIEEIFGFVGELSISSLNQKFIDNNPDIKNMQLLGGSIIESVCVGAEALLCKISNHLLPGHSGSPVFLTSNGKVSAFVTHESYNKDYNIICFPTYEMIKILRAIESTNINKTKIETQMH